MKCSFYQLQQLLCLSTFLHLSTAVSSSSKCSSNHTNKPFDFNFDRIVEKLANNSFASYDPVTIINITLNHKEIAIEAGAFKGLFCLRHLELKQNNVSNLTGLFEGLENLHVLDLSENSLENISGMPFHDLSNLSWLNLSKNKIRSVDTATFLNLTKLEILHLSFNKIRTLPVTVFSSLQNLKELYLNNNGLGDMEAESWIGLVNLEVLNLAENRIHKFDPWRNISFKNLQTLNLSGNVLTSLNVTNLRASLMKLKTIDITKNRWACKDLEVVKSHLAYSKIALVGETKCNSSGEDLSSTTEKNIPSTSAPVVQTTVANIPMSGNHSEEVIQNEMLLTQKLIEKIEHRQNIFVCLFTVVITYVLIDVGIKLGIFQCLYRKLTGRSYGRVRDAEHMLLGDCEY